MKNIFTFTLLILTIACSNSDTQEAKTETATTVSEEIPKEKNSKNISYGNLFDNYKCDISSSEVSKVMQINESDFTLVNDEKRCKIQLKGYGNASLTWGSTPGSKKSNKKIISDQLEYKAKNLSIAKMTIELSEDKNCYLWYQPMHGRIILLSENYDQAISLSYGTKNASNKRTDEQQADLKQKMADMANYLLEKHRQ